MFLTKVLDLFSLKPLMSYNSLDEVMFLAMFSLKPLMGYNSLDEVMFLATVRSKPSKVVVFTSNMVIGH